VRADKLERLREEAKSVSMRGGRLSLDASPLAKMMSEISHNITSLSADNHLFPGDSQPLRTHEEKYGFVFTPIAEPLAYQPFKATPSELQSDLGIVYKAMQTTNEEELGALLWSKAILLRALLGSEQAKKKHKSSPSMSPVQQPVVLPERICSWLFVTSTCGHFHCGRRNAVLMPSCVFLQCPCTAAATLSGDASVIYSRSWAVRFTSRSR
jgi:hypothetical protein